MSSSPTIEPNEFRRRRLSLPTAAFDECNKRRIIAISPSPQQRKKVRKELISKVLYAKELDEAQSNHDGVFSNDRSRKKKPDEPFPPNVLGVFSYHGIEPAYDDDEEDDETTETKPHTIQEVPSLKQLMEHQSANDSSLFVETTVSSFPEENDVPDIMPSPSAECIAKINQDRGGVVYPYANSTTTALFAVYDGHGTGGEHVSQFALSQIQTRLSQHSLFRSNLPKAFTDTFLSVDDALRHEPGLESVFAGTTACVAILDQNQLYVANVGDSRAVLGGATKCVELSIDQNPNVPLEQSRIEAAGGYVTPPPAVGLSARVWLDKECTQVGLAMARSLGDHAAATVGVIAEPVVTVQAVTKEDDFLILATDGVWEFISSQQAVDIVRAYIGKQGATAACQALIRAAAKRWQEEEGSYRDDITAVVVKMHELWDDDSNE